MTAPDRPVFRVVLELDIGEAAPAAFLAAWRRMAEVAGREPANLAQSLSVDPDRPSRYYIVSEWTDRAEFRRFSASPGHDQLVAELKAIGRTVSMTQMDQVLVGPAAGAVR